MTWGKKKKERKRSYQVLWGRKNGSYCLMGTVSVWGDEMFWKYLYMGVTVPQFCEYNQHHQIAYLKNGLNGKFYVNTVYHKNILIQFLCFTSHILSAQQPHVASGYQPPFVQHRSKTFVTPQKVLLPSSYPEAKNTSSKCKMINKQGENCANKEYTLDVTSAFCCAQKPVATCLSLISSSCMPFRAKEKECVGQHVL